MSIEIIKKQIRYFVGTNTPEVMAIKGDWGVGKTFSWKKFLNDNKDSMSLDKYAYVSLFGVNSLDSFKYAIFENVIHKKLIGTEANLDTFKENTSSILNKFSRRNLQHIKTVPLVKNFTTSIDSISFLSINKTLICIDDLERKGSGLDIKDILGLISQLKEQKNCKIVILLNDSVSDLDDYHKYKEKVIDIELKFAPTAEECASIAYNSGKAYYKNLKYFTTKLGIKNIRILKKIERLIDLSLPIINECEAEIMDSVISSLVLFSWSNYSSGSDNDVPSLDYIESRSYDIFGMSDKTKKNKTHILWNNILNDYGYNLVDELDKVLIDTVKTGYFIDEDFIRECKKKNRQILVSKSKDSLSKTWNLFNNNFNNNEDEVISSLYNSFIKNIDNLFLKDLNSIVLLFKSLGEREKATELICFYIDSKQEDIESFNPQDIYFRDYITDSEIAERLAAEYEKKSPKHTALEVLDKMIATNGWNEEYIKILASTSIEDYYTLFKSFNTQNISSYIYKCLQFSNYSDNTHRYEKITQHVTDALLKIASESKINKINKIRV
ncbi:hypothetical protein [Yersinia kristensenii]|uniref:hypothetical protein n=1 Tax=Yersinia kristensenii TaxID=28152 RepID=UPI0005E3477E|nr:hypothetical protein [Yersinia kristensenii]CNG50912.1 Uncharacterised protein [Yersinia kristensenii]CNK26995.1 Uncharacterised protein [Yersinia kristensenii]